MNVNTMVEIIINYLQTRDWRVSFQTAIPMCKVNSKPNLDKEYNYLNICTEEQLLALPMTRLTKFEFKNKLDRYCVQHKQKLSFLTEERDLKNKGAGTAEERGRFSVKALIDGVVMGIGEGGNMRIASAYASWRALDALGVFSQINTSDVCEDISEEL